MRLGFCGICFSAVLFLIAGPATAIPVSLSTIETTITGSGSYTDTISAFGSTFTFTFTKVEDSSGDLAFSEIGLMLMADGDGVGFDLTKLSGDGLSAAVGESPDLKLEYMVEVTAGSYAFTGGSNRLLGSAPSVGVIIVSETILEELMPPAANEPGDLGVTNAQTPVNPGEWLTESGFGGDAYTKLTISSKNITLTPISTMENVEVDRLSQRFVPEPATAGMVMLGLLGLGAASPRRG